jgi:hypothetical protein
MGFFDVVGDVVSAVGDGIDDAAHWVGDRAHDVASGVGTSSPEKWARKRKRHRTSCPKY